MQNARFLSSHALFGGLSLEELEHIMPLFREESYAGGRPILTEDQVNDRIHFIVRGSVEVTKSCGRSGAEGERLLARLGTGDTFGEMELIDIQPCAATVRAAEECTVLSLSGTDLYRISKWNLKTYTMIVMNLAREISRRLRRMDQMVLSLFSDETAGAPARAAAHGRMRPAPEQRVDRQP